MIMKIQNNTINTNQTRNRRCRSCPKLGGNGIPQLGHILSPSVTSPLQCLHLKWDIALVLNHGDFGFQHLCFYHIHQRFNGIFFITQGFNNGRAACLDWIKT